MTRTFEAGANEENVHDGIIHTRNRLLPTRIGVSKRDSHFDAGVNEENRWHYLAEWNGGR